MNKNIENMYPFQCLFHLFVWFLFFSRILCYREGGGKALGTRLGCLGILSVSKITCLPAKHEPHRHCFHCPLLLVTVLLYHSLTWWSFLKDSSIFFMCHTVGKLSFKYRRKIKRKSNFIFVYDVEGNLWNDNERFLINRRATKTTVFTLANHKGHRQCNEPIKYRRNHT